LTSPSTAYGLVSDLLQELGSPEFGLIAQAMLAICFKTFGARVESVNQLGHPDLELDYENRHWRIEVEFAGPHSTSFEVKSEDFESTNPLVPIDTGYLAVLNCNYPVHWTLIETQKLQVEGLGFHKLRKLDSIANSSLSSKCTDLTLKFMHDHRSEIVVARYPGIVEKYVLGG
jgi:hypothetical protein